MNKGKTLVIGASTNPERYSNKALNMLQEYAIPTVGIGLKDGTVGSVNFSNKLVDFGDLETISLYLNPQRQEEYIDYILAQKPKRVIFNPGTENPPLEEKLKAHGIQPIEACTLVLLRTGQF